MESQNISFTAEELSRTIARELAARLVSIGIRTEVVSDAQARAVLEEGHRDVRLSSGFGTLVPVPLHTTGGVVYGYTRNSTIYLNEDRFLPDTPVHEYTHLWLRAMRATDPGQWQDLMVAARQFPEWDELRSVEPYMYYDMELFADEVIATAVGRNGGEILTVVASAAMEMRRTDKDSLIDMTGLAIDAYVSDLLSVDLKTVGSDTLAAVIMKDMFGRRDIFSAHTEEVDFAAIGRKCAEATLAIRKRAKQRPAAVSVPNVQLHREPSKSQGRR